MGAPLALFIGYVLGLGAGLALSRYGRGVPFDSGRKETGFDSPTANPLPVRGGR